MLLEPYTLLFPHEREYFEREEKNIPENHLLQEKTGWHPSEVTLPCSALSPASLSLVRSHALARRKGLRNRPARKHCTLAAKRKTRQTQPERPQHALPHLHGTVCLGSNASTR